MKAMKVVGWVLGTLFVMSFFICMGREWLIQVPLTLALGWVAFLLRVVPEMTWRWGAIAETVAVGAVLGVGTHLFLRRLWRQLRPEEAWPVCWSASLVALIVLLFGATMATVGIGHHVGWLVSSREPLAQSSWRFLPSRVRWENEELCAKAQELSKSGVSDARMVQVLLGDEDEKTRDRAERLYVVPWKGPGGEAGFLVFPRDPISRGWADAVRCGGGLAQDEVIKAAELPRLLSESQGQVAADTAP
ncbi:hypothetical protein ACN28I_27790 [Archangium gephyra]|uniref:hypothetical protein n=1 Tax=Archangium gephyra TaxID=48 RepID=UPI003B7BD98F